MSGKSKICIYHANCTDGFAAAFSVWKSDKNEEFEFFEGVYGEDPPNVKDKDVFLVDFHYKKDVIIKMLKKAKSITILDHHKTAKEELQGFVDEGIINGIIDLNFSGSMIAWHYFNPEEPCPKVFRYIQDYDLWKHEFHETREISAAISSYPREFEVWDQNIINNTGSLVVAGRHILRSMKNEIQMALPSLVRKTTIGGYDVCVANVPFCWINEVGELLAKDMPFSACYTDLKDGRKFSLRVNKSSPLAVDVSKIASIFGGGGHPNSSGFTLSYDELDKIKIL